MAQALAADAVIEGSVGLIGSRVRLTARLVHGATDRQLWSGTYERSLEDVLTLQRELSNAVALAVQATITGEESKALATRRPVEPDAYVLYLRANHFFNLRAPDAIRKSIEYYKQAATRDPSFAAAHGGIALSEGLLAESDEPPKDIFPRVKASATRALALDPSQVDALVAMTQVQFYSDRDWRGARRAFQRIVQRYPNHALAHLWYGSLLTAIGPLEEALSLRRRTVVLDPLSLAANNSLGVVLMQMARYPQAVQSFTSALELEPAYADAHGWLGFTYIRMGRRDEGIAELERCVQLSRNRHRMVARLAHAYGLVGRKADAERLLQSLLARSRSERVGPMSLAYVYAGLGKRDQAFASLSEASREGGPVMRLKFDPLLDPLKDDPRFADVVRQLTLPWP